MVTYEKLLRVLVLLVLAASGPLGCGLEHDPEDPTMVGEDDLDNVVLEEGDISLISARFGIGDNNEFYTNLAHLHGRTLADQRFDFASGIVLKNNSSSARTATVNLVLQGYSQIATQLVQVPANGTAEVPPMNPTLDFDKLYSVTTPVASNIQLEVREGDALVDLRVETAQIQPINRFRWFWENGQGGYQDMRFLIGVLATPEDRGNAIQSLLTEAAQYTPTGSIHGYQGGNPDDAYAQAAAIYYALQERGIVYTDVSGSFFDGAQNVKTPAQSLSTGSTNCVDGMLVFASAFEAMGMDPIFIFVSGHAFVGVWLGTGPDAQWVPIETTMVSSATFDDAVNQGIANLERANATQDPYAKVLNLKDLRSVGITPANL
ncbi:hypothetical protein EA187_19045 [Lujinxingia sediminis]|uniref:Transglutaminase domain-containing protein n=1 Tax=Lujinxingia sediminis TaxID=2480984 RepID=A0ABY0CNA3_9DELT|nr:hypothetical protein [Lujinxingia sediminis]RVU41441.1 hypothetical protein EA187_19045 [Lujinxingia sediminis]